MTGLINDDNGSSEFLLLGAMIRIRIEDYSNPDNPYYEEAKRWLFENAGKTDESGKPLNKLDYWLSFTDASPDAIRRHLKKPKTMVKSLNPNHKE